eukprot:m.119448 g.119448  ORF g.119448 m.119448 type:complete len:114 (+) comp15591_c0_seq2:1242-1583(+)
MCAAASQLGVSCCQKCNFAPQGTPKPTNHTRHTQHWQLVIVHLIRCLRQLSVTTLASHRAPHQVFEAAVSPTPTNVNKNAKANAAKFRAPLISLKTMTPHKAAMTPGTVVMIG